ncbi:MAG TPA: TonB-dependent receptor plug domain-containing protein, partial [Chthoniobacterales bacterium]
MFYPRTFKLAAAALVAVLGLSARGQEATSPEVIVSAARLPDAESAAPFNVTSVDAEELRRAPQLRLDDILRAEAPGFSLFRRTSSRTANPTTQGVTLRNFGPSGAGRTLVLLDGIPLNDPFAGYVLWSQVPSASLQSVLVQPGSGAGLFGNSALAGTIFLVSKPIESSAFSAIGSIGNAETYEASVDGAFTRGPLALAVFADRFSTGGYPVIAPNQRGSIDRNAQSESSLFDLRGAWEPNAETSIVARARWFAETRGNGTPFTRNETVASDFSLSLTRKIP